MSMFIKMWKSAESAVSFFLSFFLSFIYSSNAVGLSSISSFFVLYWFEKKYDSKTQKQARKDCKCRFLWSRIHDHYDSVLAFAFAFAFGTPCAWWERWRRRGRAKRGASRVWFRRLSMFVKWTLPFMDYQIESHHHFSIIIIYILSSKQRPIYTP